MKLVLGSDHAGFALRQVLAHELTEQGHTVHEVGAPSEESYDYPNASDAVARVILRQEAELGVLICGTGIGVSIRANRYKHIRAAACSEEASARLGRLHNHANVLCMGARIVGTELAKGILKAFLETGEDESERHVRRIEQLDGNTDLGGGKS